MNNNKPQVGDIFRYNFITSNNYYIGIIVSVDKHDWFKYKILNTNIEDFPLPDDHIRVGVWSLRHEVL
jgi:hypothetical protein